MSNDMREAFEAYMRKANPMYRPSDDSMHTRREWATWQAAWAARKPREGFDKARRVATVKTKTGVRTIPVGRIAARLLDRPPFKVDPNEASTLFRKLTKQLMIDGLTFHDARGTALTHLAKKVPVEVLAKVSGHRDISLLVRTYYRPTPEEVARMI